MSAPPTAPPPRSDRERDDDAGSSRGRPRGRKRRSWARRKHLGLVTTGLVLVVLVLGVVLVVATWDNGRVPLSRQAASLTAGPSASSPPTTPTTAPATSAAPTPSSAPGEVTVRARITAVGDSRWTVTSSTGLDYTVVVTPETTLPRRRDFSSFEVGQVVSVSGTLDSGTITAATVAAGR